VKAYYLNYQPSEVPAWHFDIATARQLKVLRFFGTDVSKPLTKGRASGIIARLFSDPANEHLWAAYVYTTGDEDHTSAELRPHDRTVLSKTEIPSDWHPKQSSNNSLRKLTDRRRLTAKRELVTEILTDGSPFDEPLPEITLLGTAFCFTGLFQYGTRKECQAAILSRGGRVSEHVNSQTDVLVIGHDANPNWAEGNFGNKICEAMVLKLQNCKPLIIPESYWRTLLQISGAC
jgi:NAD-dependent DNA ligase